ncbi:hypothetical protein D3C72_1045770 [compost metagenome]
MDQIARSHRERGMTFVERPAWRCADAQGLQSLRDSLGRRLRAGLAPVRIGAQPGTGPQWRQRTGEVQIRHASHIQLRGPGLDAPFVSGWAVQCATLPGSDAALVWNDDHQQADATLGELLLQINHCLDFGIGIALCLMIDLELIGQKQPVRTTRANPWPAVTEQEPADTALQLGEGRGELSVRQFPGDPMSDIAVKKLRGQHFIGQQRDLP